MIQAKKKKTKSFRRRLIKTNIRLAIIPIVTFLLLILIVGWLYRHEFGNAEVGSSRLREDSFYYIMIAILAFVSILILVICTIYANRVVKRLMIPLLTLCDGAKRVSEGDLSSKLTYCGEDEFEMVCSAFNEMQERLKDNIQKNIELEQRKQEMIAGISHDLKTPLTAIKGYARGILDGVANTEEKQKRYLEQIELKTDEMGKLISELFLFSKLETGKVTYRFEVCEIEKYIEEYYEAVREEYKEQGVKLSLELIQKEALAKKKVLLDQNHMNRVLHNILNNSVKYYEGEGLQICLSVQPDTDKVLISVKDNGYGVPEDKLPFLFDSFYRVDEARANPEKGSGLGLAIVKNIVLAHGGEVSAENARGLTIKINLPVIGSERGLL